MTEQELDKMMRRVLMDALTLDKETAEETPEFEPSLHHQREVSAMLKDPARWAKRRMTPAWKRFGSRVAAVLLVASLGVAVVSPTARATVVSYVMNWYESFVDFRYAKDDASDELPDYAFAVLPESYQMVEAQSLRTKNYAVEWYENEVGEVILLEYARMQDGTVVSVDTTGAEVTNVTVNGMDGFLFLSSAEGEDNTLTWVDEERGVQLTLHATLGGDDLLHMAESVKLVEMTK